MKKLSGNEFRFKWMLVVVLLFIASNGALSIEWKRCLRQEMSWYGTSEAIRVADQVLLYQREAGGWPKNIDMAKPLSKQEEQALQASKSNNKDCTIDNGATYSQLQFLAKVYHQTRQDRFKAAFLKGLQFLLDLQYDNGGWPQFYHKSGYSKHITFNDNAMIGVMRLLRDIAQSKPLYDFVDASLKDHCQKAVDKGVDCILKCQVVVDGKKTVWCAQHDEVTYQPAPARSYEKISLSGSESVGIVAFLMDIDPPTPEIIEAIESAVAWFKKVQLTGIREVRKPDPDLPKGYDKIIVKDASAPPLWARFYEIGSNRPIFCGRDGIIKYHLSEIEHERRVGYSWYTSSPADLLKKKYPAWKAEHTSAVKQ